MFGLGRLGLWGRKARGSSLVFPITEVQGGTNQTTYAAGDMLYASAANTLSKLAAGTEGQQLTMVSGLPGWQDPFALTKKVVWAYEDFVSGHQGPPLIGANGGTNSINAMRAAASTAANPGGWRQATGTTTTGYANLMGSTIDNTLKIGGGAGQCLFETVIRLSRLSDGTDTYTSQIGIVTPAFSNTLTITDGIYFRYTHSASAGNWELRSVSASSTTTVDTGVAASTNFVRLRFILNAAGTSIQAYINGVAAGAPITTNIPAATTGMMQQWFILKSAGTTTVNQDIDAYVMAITLASAR